MAAIISVPVQIAQMGEQVGISEAYPAYREPQATVTFTCAASDRYQLIQDLVGTVVAAGNSAIRTYPYQYPPSPNLICTAIESVEFYGKPELLPGLTLPWLARSMCKVRARFGLPAWFQGTQDPSGLPYTTTSISLGADVLTLPDTTYTFPSGWTTTTPIGLKVPKAIVTMKRHQMPFVPVAQVFPIIGCVNANVVTLAGFACAVGTLLFAGFSSTLTADVLGHITYDIEYQFEYRVRPWNQFLSPAPTEGWTEPTDGNGNPVFASADFSQIP
jgi:hypothetical protein